MSGHGIWLLGELIGAGFMTLSVVLLAVAGTAAALVSGRMPRPVPPPLAADRVEPVLLQRYARGDIDAAEYHSALARATETV